MPLSKRQFELGVDEEAEAWMRQIYDLLAGQPESAYSSEELSQLVLGDSQDRTNVEKLGSALSALVDVQAVEKGNVRGEQYYAFRQEVDTTSWKRKPEKTKIHRFG